MNNQEITKALLQGFTKPETITKESANAITQKLLEVIGNQTEQIGIYQKLLQERLQLMDAESLKQLTALATQSILKQKAARILSIEAGLI